MVTVYIVWTEGGYVSGDSGECRAVRSHRANWYSSYDAAASVASRVGGQVVGWQFLRSSEDCYGLPGHAG